MPMKWTTTRRVKYVSRCYESVPLPMSWQENPALVDGFSHATWLRQQLHAVPPLPLMFKRLRNCTRPWEVHVLVIQQAGPEAPK